MKRSFHDFWDSHERSDEKRIRLEQYLGSKRYIELHEDPSLYTQFPHKIQRQSDGVALRPTNFITEHKNTPLQQSKPADTPVSIGISKSGLCELLMRDEQRLFDGTRPNPEGLELVLYTEPIFPRSSIGNNQQTEYIKEDTESFEMIM
jgi:hypothetical protein